ncbi:MAG: serine/threonine-protein kinase [Coleofasciculaceae cyanobacterium]
MDTQYQPDDVISDRYRIVAPLGQGGMGTTYEAEDLTNYQRVAIKALSLRQIREWKVLELFEREARVLANLEHPAIPKYLDYFPLETADNRSFYLVRELVSGDSLADLVEKGWHPNESEVKQIAVQVLEILNYLHQLTPPVIHRDIKPQNIIRCPDGRVFLVDFGSVQEVYRNTLTRGGTFVGTLGYVPQEQFSGSVQPASDLYSLAATLLFLLTKKSPDELPIRRMKIDFRRYVKVLPEFADWLEEMLEPAVEDRFESAKIALKALGKNKNTTSYLPLPTQSKYKPPKRFRVKKSDQHLLVEILPRGEGYAWMGFFFCLFVSITYQFATTILLFCLFFCFTCLWKFAIHVRLEIDKQNFRIQWMIWKFTTGRTIGKTADIERIERVDIKTKNSTISCIIFWEGVHQHRLSVGNKDDDQWLVSEVSDFLLQLRYGKR